VALLVAILVVGATVPAPTFAKCQPTGRANNHVAYFAGWYRNTVSGLWGGVYSNIKNYSPWVQSGTSTSAWVMLTLKTGGINWAQVGWYEEAGGVRHTFTQWTKNNTWYTNFYSPKPVNTYTYYTVLWDNLPRWTFQVAGVTVGLVAASFSPDASQVMGEIHTLSSQMPGGSGSSNHEWFSDTHVYSTQWINYDGTPTGNQTYWTSVKSSSTGDYTYDKACTT
jgi:hypothetical protein